MPSQSPPQSNVPLQSPFSPIAEAFSRAGIENFAEGAWVIAAFAGAFVVLYTLLLLYHWLRYGDRSIILITSAITYGVGQLLFVGTAASALLRITS